MALDTSFLKKLVLPRFSLPVFAGGPASVAGIDIGASSTKVVQLRYEGERAILETYGELLNEGYLKIGEGTGAGFLRYADNDIASLLKDLIRESNVTAKDAVMAVPAVSSFITTITFPAVAEKEIEQAVPFEARKYIPVPVSEVILDWDILGPTEGRDTIDVLLVAVPREIIDKLKRVADLGGIKLKALEVETFSMIRSLGGRELVPMAYINLGYQTTTLAIVDMGKLRVSYTFGRGSSELTKALARGLGISNERAEGIKREVGMSERIEEREITSIIAPLMAVLFAEIERTVSLYNRKTPRKIQKINLTGGGSNLKGLVEHTASKFGVEVTQGNPFGRVVTPAFMQPILREIGPSFSVAVGLALHGIASR